MSYGFGFGAGGGDNPKSGTGAGGSIKPRGAIIIDDNGVCWENLKAGMSNVFETMAECCSHMMEMKRGGDGKKDKGTAAKKS